MKKCFVAALALIASVSFFQPQMAFAETDIQEQEIVNNGDFVFTIKSFEKNSDDDPLLNVYIENNTDQDLVFSFLDTCVNGWLCEPYWGCEIAAGTKVNDRVIWYPYILETNHITDITGIEAELSVMETENWNTVYQEKFTYYPSGEEVFIEKEYEPQETDVVLVDNDFVTVSALSLNLDNEWDECQLLLYIKNKTDKDVSVGIRDALVNGTMCDACSVCDLPKGKQAYSKVIWFSSLLLEKQIDEIESFTLPLYVIDTETFDEIYKETLTVNKADLLIIE